MKPALGDYRIERFAPEHAVAVASLQTELWTGDVQLNRAYLQWKYQENPFLPTPQIYVALLENRVVGMRGYFGAQWECDSERMMFPCACDLVVQPEHRDSGLVRRLLTESQAEIGMQGIPFLVNLSGGSPLTHVVQLALGWKSIGPLGPLVRLDRRTRIRRRLSRALERWRRRELATRAPEQHGVPVTRTIPQPWSGFDQRARRMPTRNVRVTAPAEGVAEICGAVSPESAGEQIRHVRTAEWLRWRLKNPFSDYRCLFFGETPDGYLVLSASRLEGEGYARIVDYHAPTPGIAAALLDAAIRWGRFRRLYIWSFSLPRVLREAVDSRGFISLEPAASFGRPRRSALIASTIPPSSFTLGTRSLIDPSNWQIRSLDSDGV